MDDNGGERRLNKDQAIGAIILVGSIVGIIVYGWLLCNFATIVLQLTALVAVVGVLGILGWIGWTMATTPPPAPLEPEVTQPAGLQATTSTSGEAFAKTLEEPH